MAVNVFELERLEAILNNIDDEVWVSDTAGNVKQLNKAAQGAHGLQVDGRPVLEVVDLLEILEPDGTPRLPKNTPMLKALKGETVNGEEIVRHLVSGELRYRRFKCAPLRVRNGDIIGTVTLSRDITEQKRTEEALRQSLLREEVLGELTWRLLESEDPQVIMEEVCKRAINYLNCDVFVNYIAKKDYLLLNAYAGIPYKAAEKIKHLQFGEAVCGCVYLEGERIVVPDVQNSTDPRVQLVKSLGIQSYASFPLKTDKHAIGTLSFGSRRRTAFSDEELQFMSIVAGHVSIAMNRRLTSKALRESQQKAVALVAELEKSDKNKSHFLNVLSHELRNPLSSISAGLSLLEISDDKKLVSDAKEIINRQMKQLCKLVDDLLDLTRISQNKIQLKKETFQLNKMISDIANDMKLRFKKKGVHFWVMIQPRPVFISADQVRLTQCIENVLTNALKFTQEDGDVWLTLEQKKDDAVISVKDNGVGISQEMIRQLFQPFMQADMSEAGRGNSGLGLGLSIVKSIIEMHGGQVTAQSDGMGQGALFTIRLPSAAKRR
jgi:PAS domain S-box-containing protein